MQFRLKNLIFPLNRPISRQVILLAMPVILSNLSRVFMNLADLAMVGRLGAPALAAVGMGSMVAWTVLSTAISLRTAVQTVAARRLGQKIFAECGTALHNGLFMAAITGIPLSIIGFSLADKIAPLLLEDPTVIPLCIDYMSVAFLSVFFASIGFAFQGFFTGVEKTRIHMNVTIVANLLNIYLNAGLIYGREGVVAFFSELGNGSWAWLGYAWSWIPFPAMGVKGAATATLLASAWLVVHYSAYLVLPEIRKRYQVFNIGLNWTMLRKQLTLAIPQAAQELFVMGGFVVFFKIVGMIGTAELAATEVVFGIMGASFMPAAGVGQACATLVGKFLGEQRPDKSEISIFESVRWSLLIMGTMGIIFFIFPEKILPLFTSDQNVIQAGIVGLRVLAFAQFADAIGITLWFALTGAGNTVYPAIVEIAISWGFFLPVSYLTGVVLGLGFLGSWLTFAVYILIFATLMAWKIIKGDWKSISV